MTINVLQNWQSDDGQKQTDTNNNAQLMLSIPPFNNSLMTVREAALRMGPTVHLKCFTNAGFNALELEKQSACLIKTRNRYPV